MGTMTPLKLLVVNECSSVLLVVNECSSLDKINIFINNSYDYNNSHNSIH